MSTDQDKISGDPGLAAVAAAADQASTEAPAIEQGGAAPVDYLAEAKGLIEFAHALLVPLYPSLDKVYTADVRGRLAGVAGPLMEKYGLTLGDVFAKWAPEINFALVAVPLIAPTVQAIRADRAALADGSEKETSKPADTPAASSGSVPPASGLHTLA